MMPREPVAVYQSGHGVHIAGLAQGDPLRTVSHEDCDVLKRPLGIQKDDSGGHPAATRRRRARPRWMTVSGFVDRPGNRTS
jgi:hypothetical protein